ncbi:lipoprotein [Alishewanella sp. HH-ZS]|jgi:predicted small lipoprotein YifL|uniref:LPS translocon maturation chaperone LptM n=1 Tax=Alishewanella sp. HH-ZS TaxID=1856684 RepID=UPI0009F1EA1B|nr:lipoprotein [Alishewanella sp. HH-ZS]
MHAQQISRLLRLLTGALLATVLLSACGQKGPLTLPQAEPEVAAPPPQKITEDTESQG